MVSLQAATLMPRAIPNKQTRNNRTKSFQLPMQRNLLQVTLCDFKIAMKPFAAKRRRLGTVLLAFEGGFLSIESGEVTAVMHAEGSWHGRAQFSPEVLRAIATFPLSQDPITISYADGHVLIGTMTIPCQWESSSKQLIQVLTNPDLVDLLALGKSISRAEYLGSGLGKKIRSAQEKAERRIKSAATQLADLDITETEIRKLVESRVADRLGVGKKSP